MNWLRSLFVSAPEPATPTRCPECTSETPPFLMFLLKYPQTDGVRFWNAVGGGVYRCQAPGCGHVYGYWIKGPFKYTARTADPNAPYQESEPEQKPLEEDEAPPDYGPPRPRLRSLV